MLQFGVSLTYDTISVDYNHNMFIIQATDVLLIEVGCVKVCRERLVVTIKMNIFQSKYLQKSASLQLYRIYKARVLFKMTSLKDATIFKANFVACSLMRIFHPVNSLVVSWNLWLILLRKIWLFLNLVKHTSKISKILRIPNLCLFFL